MKRIGIVGSRKYINRRKIREFIFNLREKFGDEVEIVSGGCKQGADHYAKKISLEFDMKYVEYPPKHFQYNQHCILDSSEYGKPYRVTNYFNRNKQIAEHSDYIVAFIPKGHTSRGTNNTIEYATKLDKKVVILD
ncbi:DUF2493 domain-containing protein [Candidatus Woesearchaeota archaeon]|jgi:predicted Rossmann fold nucleotide-binding protein DprA/Smf involved in DNA uptake|nr:DUF2493 domain-containing protein [Candidatus Woesearchaeota archaeon]MBT4731280.1 DUF2493 domain-containing protein [Candidatus Woesearchaeota archaeon]MBT7558442.1 DUF2493 domain-containing protein [Candidatus Woesearchaeota archaeon]